MELALFCLWILPWLSRSTVGALCLASCLSLEVFEVSISLYSFACPVGRDPSHSRGPREIYLCIRKSHQVVLPAFRAFFENLSRPLNSNGSMGCLSINVSCTLETSCKQSCVGSLPTLCVASPPDFCVGSSTAFCEVTARGLPPLHTGNGAEMSTLSRKLLVVGVLARADRRVAPSVYAAQEAGYKNALCTSSWFAKK